MKKFTSCICNNANSLVLRARTALSNQRGDFYISDAVKIIIAVVLGALLLATGPRFLFFKKRITEVQDEYTLQILFLSACHWWKLAQRHFYLL